MSTNVQAEPKLKLCEEQSANGTQFSELTVRG